MNSFIEKVRYNEGQTMLYWLGQAGFVIQSQSGQLLGIDLYLSECVERVEGHAGYHRLMPQIVSPDELELNALVATHFHRDHFDIDAIPQLMKRGNARLFCAYDCVEDVENLIIDKSRTSFVQPGDCYEVGDFCLTYIHSDHGIGAPKAVGVIIEVDGKRILEVGDTCLHLDWTREYTQRGPLDVLVAPINGAYGNLNEQDNVTLTKALQPKLTVPCHFGMFASHGGLPGLWKELLEEQLPNQLYKLFTMGEGVYIK